MIGKRKCSSFLFFLEENEEFIVKGLFSQPAQENEVELTWQTCNKADGYLIYGYHGNPKSGAMYQYIGMRTGNEKGIMTYIDHNASKDYNFYFVYPYRNDASGKKIVGKCCKYTYTKGGQVTKLPAVTNLKATALTGACELTWDKVEGAEGYLIYGFHGSPREVNVKYEYFGMTTDTKYIDKKGPDNRNSYYFVFPYYTNKEGKMVPGMTAPYVYGHHKWWYE